MTFLLIATTTEFLLRVASYAIDGDRATSTHTLEDLYPWLRIKFDKVQTARSQHLYMKLGFMYDIIQCKLQLQIAKESEHSNLTILLL